MEQSRVDNELPVFVINLDDDSERLQSISRQLDSLNLPFERFSAYKGSDIPDRWRRILFEADGSTRLSAGEVGCYASHLGCMARFLDGTAATALILEDDVEFRPGLLEILADPKRMPAGWDLLRLIGNPKSAWVPIASVGRGYELAIYSRILVRMGAYCVSRPGARKLISHGAMPRYPIDTEIRYAYRMDLAVYGVVPEVAFESGRHRSSIGEIRGYPNRRRSAEAWRRVLFPVEAARGMRFNLRRLSWRTWWRCAWRNLLLRCLGGTPRRLRVGPR